MVQAVLTHLFVWADHTRVVREHPIIVEHAAPFCILVIVIVLPDCSRTVPSCILFLSFVVQLVVNALISVGARPKNSLLRLGVVLSS